MIYDHIQNISLYKGISPALDIGLDYLLTVNKEIENGVVLLDNGVKAIISEYSTKVKNENGYEAHRQYIDIQFPVDGIEMVKFCPLEYLTPTMDYDEEKDYILFSEQGGVDFTIGDGYFLVLFPEDAHMPQLCVENPEIIKKLTLKVPVR